jgi:putative isomerase
MHNEFGWETWTAERPTEFTHLETGLLLTPVLYSDRSGIATELPPGSLLRYGHRGLFDGRIEFSTLFEETHLDWVCKRQGDSLDLSWVCRANGEWGLRYWICLCLSCPEGISFSYDRMAQNITAETEHGKLHARCSERPLLVTAHEDADALMNELKEYGYFYLNSRATRGKFLALRFNLDETPEMSIKIDFAASKKSQLKHKPEGTPETTLQTVHDVLAWNHVWDFVNKRPYTALTRNWSQKKFGGFGIWLNDILFHALLWTLIDPSKARQNIEAVFAHQTEAGNFPCLVTGNDAWLDRSQLPMASYVVWAVYRTTGDQAFLKWAYPKLYANHQWWWQQRALANTGLVAYGTSSGPGDGLYKGTKLAARNESAMDNMAVHDEAEFDPQSGLMQSADVGLNSLLALDGEVLAAMADMLGFSRDFTNLSDRTRQHKGRIQEWLWDDDRSVFANRLVNGKFVDALAPTSFFPMVAGAATAGQVEALVTQYLKPEDKFGGKYTLPSAARDQPAYKDNMYWRGRVWAPLNFWVHQGLLRYERQNEAEDLARKSRAMFQAHWDNRHCSENYSAIDGDINDQADTDHFYTWGALLPALSLFNLLFEGR